MATRDPNARLKYAKQEPAFNGALIDNDWIGAGLFVRQTNAQKLAIGKDFRVLDGDTTTIVMVTGGSEPLTYKLINNPDTEATQESDWQLLPSGGGSAVEPVGEFDAVTGFIVPSTTSLQDTDAVGNNGQYYVVTQAPTGITDTYAGLFRGLEVTLFDGDFVLSVGDYYAVVRPASTWDSIGVPQVVQDYVNGTVIAHNHTIAQVTGLTGALGLKYDVSNVASDLIDYDNNAGDELANKDFLDTYYYRKYGTGLDKSLTTYSASEIDALVVGVGAGSGLSAGAGSVIDLGGTMTSSVNLYWDEAISTPLEFSVYAENSNETKSSEFRVKDDNIIVYADTADSYAQYYLTGETIGLQHEEYNLINKEQEIYFSPLFDFIRFRHNDGTNYDTFHGVAGLYYGDDYDALGVSTHGDNWIPSYRAVKDYADNGSFWKLAGTTTLDPAFGNVVIEKPTDTGAVVINNSAAINNRSSSLTIGSGAIDRQIFSDRGGAQNDFSETQWQSYVEDYDIDNAGASSGYSTITLRHGFFELYHSLNNYSDDYYVFFQEGGLHYLSDYDALAISNFGDNWIPSYRAVKAYADTGFIKSGGITNTTADLEVYNDQLYDIEFVMEELTGTQRNNALRMTANSTFIDWYDNDKNSFWTIVGNRVGGYAENYVTGNITTLDVYATTDGLRVGHSGAGYTTFHEANFKASGWYYDLTNPQAFDGTSDDGWLPHYGIVKPQGSNNDIQFKNGVSFGSDTGFYYDPAKDMLVGGAGSLVPDFTLAHPQSGSWSGIFGEQHTFLAGRSANLLVTGWHHTIGDDSIGGVFAGASVFVSGIDNEAHGVTSTAIGFGVAAHGNSSFALGAVSRDGGGLVVPGDQRVLAAGQSSVNISYNTTAQTLGHGALATSSVILGGQNHNIPADSPRSVILGGNALKMPATTPDMVMVPNLMVNPTAGDYANPADGQIWYNLTTNKFRVRENGVTADLAGGGGSSPTIVDKNIAALQTTANGQPSGATITNTPVGYVQVMVNGVQQWLGDGIKTASCYFSADGGVTAKAISEIVATDVLYWNGSITGGFQLEAVKDRIDLNYNV
jgi:hypothetical protein